MRLLYNLFVWLYPLAARVLSIKNTKAKQWINGRKSILRNISQAIHPEDNIIWFHCASLGEFEQGRPLIEYLKKQQPDYKILLTFFSPSGYEVRKNYDHADYVFYLPNDTPSNAKKFMQIVQPKYIFFIKYEFWCNYIHQAYLKEIPFYSVSSIFSKRQAYFSWYGKWFRKQLRKITHFFTQNQDSVELLKQYGIMQASVAGDTRFDRVLELAANKKDISFFSHLKTTDTVVVAGSTWQKDEELLSLAIKKHRFKLILAPHEVHAEHIEAIEKQFSEFSTIRFSQIVEDTPIADIQVFIIDFIGILNTLYSYGNLAYIGGGFGKGIHNILEAATYGKPVIFGTNHKKFKEANDLIALSAAFSISDISDLNTIISDLFSNPEKMKIASNCTQQYVLDNAGACNRVYEFVFGS